MREREGEREREREREQEHADSQMTSYDLLMMSRHGQKGACCSLVVATTHTRHSTLARGSSHAHRLTHNRTKTVNDATLVLIQGGE